MLSTPLVVGAPNILKRSLFTLIYGCQALILWAALTEQQQV